MRQLLALLFVLSLGIQACGPRQLEPPFVCQKKSQSDAASPEDSLKLNSEADFIDIRSGRVFYWFVPAENDDGKKPFTVWLHGGLGESGLVPMFLGNGPYRLNPGSGRYRLNSDLSLYANEASWHKFSNMLYIDQPVGVGLSQTSLPLARTLGEVAIDVYNVIRKFLISHPAMAARDFYLFGDGFAGSVIPHVAKTIVTNPALGFKNLKGIGIGGGTIDLASHWHTLPEFAFEAGLISPQETDFATRFLAATCELDRRAYLARGIVQIPPSCEVLVGYVKNAANTPFLGDYRRMFDYSDEMSAMECYLNAPEVLRFIKFRSDEPFRVKNPAVFKALTGTELESQTANIRTILNGGIKVLIFGGMTDMYVNPLGLRFWADEFASDTPESWADAQDFREQAFDYWQQGKEQLGQFRAGGGLTVVFLDNAGQLVSKDVPMAAQTMFSQFINRDNEGVRNQ